jgi:hypothetical protein
MTRTLVSIIPPVSNCRLSDSEFVDQLIATADEALLAQMQELERIPSDQRRRYWRCLLEAMNEDEAMPIAVTHSA